MYTCNECVVELYIDPKCMYRTANGNTRKGKLRDSSAMLRAQRCVLHFLKFVLYFNMDNVQILHDLVLVKEFL